MRTVTFSAVKFQRICAGTGRTVALALMMLTICLFGSRNLNAQQDLGYILGTVTDQQGAAVVGANVTITFITTGLSQTVTTNETGFYTSRPLQVGNYSLSVEKAGFSKSTIPNIVVDAAAKVQSNVTLQVGAATTNVTVEAMPSLINTTDAIVGATIDNRAAEQLPVNGRSVLALATLSPGVASAVGAVSEGFQNRGTAVSAIKISGGVSGVNENLLDGTTNMQLWLGEVAVNLKSDSVQEYRILSGIVPAQFGYTSGGVVTVVSRAGGNKIHGGVYEFLRNDALDAESSFPRPAYGKPELRFNNYGGTLGGPVLRDKLFLFGNYEQYNYVSKYPGYHNVPTDQERAGDFSDLGQLVNGVCQPVNIYDIDNLDANGNRTQFSDGGVLNKIPNNRLDPVALAYQNKFYPKANNTTGGYNSCSHANNYVSGEPVLSHERLGVVRADYKLSDNDNWFARYAYYLNHTNNGGGMNNAYEGRNDDLLTQSAALGETHMFSATLLNDARFGLMIGDFPFVGATANQDVAGQIGLPNSTPLMAPTFNNGYENPNITLGFRSSADVELVDDVAWTVKNHSLHIGASARWTEAFNNQTGASPSGTYNFSNGTSAQNVAGSTTNIVSGTGNGYASYLLGQTTGGNMLVQYGTAWRRMLYAGYIQDDWRVSPKLTLNLGLRYDLQLQASEKHNGIENFDITQPNPVTPSYGGYNIMGVVQYAATGGYGRNFVHENFHDWGPRLGFAYSLSSKDIVRGGLAIYYPSTAAYTYDGVSGNNAGYTTMTTSWSATTTNGYLFDLKNGLPGTWNQPLGAAGGPDAFLGQGASYMNPYAKTPSAQVFALTYSRDLGFGTVIDVTYAGNHGNHFMNFSPNLNFLDPQYYHLGTAALNANVPNPFLGMPGMIGTLGTAATITKKTSLLPYPYMSGVNMQARNGYYWSNLGMINIQRRAENGLALSAAYTFSKTTDAGIIGEQDLSAYGTGTSASPQNPYNPKGDHSVDTIDATHRLSISAIYDLPFGKNKRFANSGGKLDRLVSGWQIGTILTFQSGWPLGITGGTNQLGGVRPNLNPNVAYKVAHGGRDVLYNTGHLMWFNPNGFLNPADYTFGNVPRKFGDLRAPGVSNVDLSAYKTTHITEGVTFEFRIEGYNAFNHPNLAGPSTGFGAGSPLDPSQPYAGGQGNVSATFGYITSGATTTRNVQLGGKIFF